MGNVRDVNIAPDQVLKLAQVVLDQYETEVNSRGWATFFCPFHPDKAGGNPNFGVNLNNGGQWKCLRAGCDARGRSIVSLAWALGKHDLVREWRRTGVLPPLSGRGLKGGPLHHRHEEETPPSPIPVLLPAVSRARRFFWQDKRAGLARRYLWEREVDPITAFQYGLGVGMATPDVPQDVIQAALSARLARKSREGRVWWLWINGVVYADPPAHPQVIIVRYPVPRTARNGKALRYMTWGKGRTRPLGAWMVGANTKVLVVVEGMFDMFAFAQVLRLAGRLGEVVPVALGGGASAAVMRWLAAWKGQLIVVPDPDESGQGYASQIREWRMAAGKEEPLILVPPRELDPDEALHAGWLPPEIFGG